MELEDSKAERSHNTSLQPKEAWETKSVISARNPDTLLAHALPNLLSLNLVLSVKV